MKNGECLPSCGALKGTTMDSCAGLIEGKAYDVIHCCLPILTTTTTTSTTTTTKVTTTTSTSTTTTTLFPPPPNVKDIQLSVGGTFPSLTYYNGSFWVAAHISDTLLRINQLDFPMLYDIKILPGGLAFAKLDSFNGELIVIYRDGDQGVIKNLTTGTTEGIGYVGGNWPVANMNGYLAWQSDNGFVKRRNLATGETVTTTQPNIATGISRILPDGTLAMTDNDRFLIPGYTCPCWAGDMIAAEIGDGGVAVFQGTNKWALWPGEYSNTPSCAAGGGKYAVASWGPFIGIRIAIISP